jgi:uncharacterized protein
MFLRTFLCVSAILLGGVAGCGDDAAAPTGANGAGGEAAGGGGVGGAGEGAGGSPCVPVAAATETVHVENDLGVLEGTLSIPETCGPAPVVLILSGSGSGDRNGDEPQMYRMLAEALLAEGIASLRYDDHGVDGSFDAAPPVEDFRFDLEIADAARWITLLRDDARLGPVVVAGHSQGSLTGILAARAAPIDALISLAGAGRPVGRLMHDQLAPALTAEQLAALDEAIAKLEAGEIAGPLPPPLDQLFPVEVQPYLISWMKFDPSVEIARLHAPAFIVQGLVDTQVKVIDAGALRRGKPDAEFLLIPDMCHVLKQADGSEASQHAAYTDPSVPLAPDLVPALAAFVTKLR